MASPRAARHSARLAECHKTSVFLNREADIEELLRINYDAPWERSFQLRPFVITVLAAFGVGAAANIHQLAPKRGEHYFITVDVCKRLDFQSPSVTQQSKNARMLRSTKALVTPLALLPQQPG
jgi:hypothetical protein